MLQDKKDKNYILKILQHNPKMINISRYLDCLSWLLGEEEYGVDECGRSHLHVPSGEAQPGQDSHGYRQCAEESDLQNLLD